VTQLFVFTLQYLAMNIDYFIEIKEGSPRRYWLPLGLKDDEWIGPAEPCNQSSLAGPRLKDLTAAPGWTDDGGCLKVGFASECVVKSSHRPMWVRPCLHRDRAMNSRRVQPHMYEFTPGSSKPAF
jgi:hypothetical protein